MPATGPLAPAEPGRQDLRIVDNYQIFRVEKLGQVCHAVVYAGAAAFWHNKQARLITRFNWMVRNQRWIERKIKLREEHYRDSDEVRLSSVPGK